MKSDILTINNFACIIATLIKSHRHKNHKIQYVCYSGWSKVDSLYTLIFILGFFFAELRTKLSLWGNTWKSIKKKEKKLALRFSDWLSDWLAEWLTGWLIYSFYSLIGWLIDFMIDWLIVACMLLDCCLYVAWLIHRWIN